SVRGGFWIERTVRKLELDFADFIHFIPCLFGEEGMLPLFPDVVFCFLSGMDQVGFVKPIIAQFIHHDLVSREIADGIYSSFQICTKNPEHTFTQLIFSHAVFNMPYWAEG